MIKTSVEWKYPLEVPKPPLHVDHTIPNLLQCPHSFGVWIEKLCVHAIETIIWFHNSHATKWKVFSRMLYNMLEFLHVYVVSYLNALNNFEFISKRFVNGKIRKCWFVSRNQCYCETLFVFLVQMRKMPIPQFCGCFLLLRVLKFH